MGLYENLHTETVSHLALRVPVIVHQDATIRDAILAMRARNLGCVIVVNEKHVPLGLFPESELTTLLSKNPKVVEEPLVNYLGPAWPTVKQSDVIAMVLDALESKNVRFLIVVDEQGKLVGLTGQKGLMEYVAEHFPGQVIVQRIGGSPYPADREGA
jgi:predicted transcriptional regulator